MEQAELKEQVEQAGLTEQVEQVERTRQLEEPIHREPPEVQQVTLRMRIIPPARLMPGSSHPAGRRLRMEPCR